jgi:hypothetical protein
MSIGLYVLTDEKRDHLGPPNPTVGGWIVSKYAAVLLEAIRVARLYCRPELKLPKPGDCAHSSQTG